MRRFDIGLSLALLILFSSPGLAQFKSQVEEQARVSDVFIHQSPSLLFGWFNPDQFHMSHSVSFTYQSFAGQGISLGTYTNSMRYDIADNMTARADVSLSYSPYSSISTFGKNDLSSLYLSRAQVDYRPWDNVLFQVQYRNLPYGYYGYGSPFYNPWYREGGY
jgi:hypothetical protein